MGLDWLWQNQKKVEEPVQQLPDGVGYPCGCSFKIYSMIGLNVQLCPNHFKKFDHLEIGYLIYCMQTGNYPPMPTDLKNREQGK